jgi:hypothetical protein
LFYEEIQGADQNGGTFVQAHFHFCIIRLHGSQILAEIAAAWDLLSS